MALVLKLCKMQKCPRISSMNIVSAVCSRAGRQGCQAGQSWAGCGARGEGIRALQKVGWADLSRGLAWFIWCISVQPDFIDNAMHQRTAQSCLCVQNTTCQMHTHGPMR